MTVPVRPLDMEHVTLIKDEVNLLIIGSVDNPLKLVEDVVPVGISPCTGWTIC